MYIHIYTYMTYSRASISRGTQIAFMHISSYSYVYSMHVYVYSIHVSHLDVLTSAYVSLSLRIGLNIHMPGA